MARMDLRLQINNVFLCFGSQTILFLFNFSKFFVHFVCFMELYFVLMQLNLAILKGESYMNQTFLNRSSSMLDGKDISKKKNRRSVV